MKNQDDERQLDFFQAPGVIKSLRLVFSAIFKNDKLTLSGKTVKTMNDCRLIPKPGHCVQLVFHVILLHLEIILFTEPA